MLPLNDFHYPVPSLSLPMSSSVIDSATCLSPFSTTPAAIHHYVYRVHLFRQATSASQRYTPSSGDISQPQSCSSLVGLEGPSIKPSIYQSQTTAWSPFLGNPIPILTAYDISSPRTVIAHPTMTFSTSPPSPYPMIFPSTPSTQRNASPRSHERSSLTALSKRSQPTRRARTELS